ncbi:DUF1294 domain-containing protein [Mycoplana dimorpha]|uniref:Uncharacterized membrane protein YsdA (DUF1294 family) n=1 Tax=Mycoplana dimorpha TaxID=28320 RepID=A0A2T5BIW0_MYCDI|nr:DUF1294 domain-containing protein [Mycoplana dimorpha]PTM98910.1 uncharacterized membrane protein YsdA (DUF1294 family) [Mycoplana dimorpha]
MNAVLVAAILLLVNVLTFLAFCHDKAAAGAGEWRVPERTLLGLALVGGSLGAVLAQRLLRHKTRKEPFRSILALIIGCQLAMAIAWIIAPQWLLRMVASMH